MSMEGAGSDEVVRLEMRLEMWLEVRVGGFAVGMVVVVSGCEWDGMVASNSSNMLLRLVRGAELKGDVVGGTRERVAWKFPGKALI